MTKTKTDDLAGIYDDIIRTLTPRIERHATIYMERLDGKALKRIQTRLAKLVSDTHPDPIYEWEEDSDE